jgi:hypothetical protein
MAEYDCRGALIAAATPLFAAKGFNGGGAWLPYDTIVFAGDGLTGLDRVPARGGPPERILTLDQKAIQLIVAPWALPGGKAVLCSVRTGEEFATAVVSLADRTSGRSKGCLRPMRRPARGLPPGTSLLALPRSVRPRLGSVLSHGHPHSVASQVRLSTSHACFFVYVPRRGPRDDRLAWIDRRMP